MSSQASELIVQAKHYNSTTLLASQTNQGTYFVSVRVLMGKRVRTTTAHLSSAMLKLVVDAFDPDHSIRRRTELLRQKHGLRELGTVLVLHK